MSSRVAGCPYCTAHSCSFALRRGAPAGKVARALGGGEGDFSRGELATIAVARSLGRVPCELTAAEREELIDVFGPARAEWIVLGVVMMGFLNKFMNTIGVELEQSVYSEVSRTLGPAWSAGAAGAELDLSARAKPAPPADGLATKLRVVPLLPGALRLDASWQRGVPGAWPQAGTYLRERTGHDFPVLARLRHRRARRAIAFMLRENLSAQTTTTGLDAKIRCGVVFTEAVADEALADDARALAAAHRIDLDAASGDPRTDAALLLARAASPSPAEIDAAVVGACRDAGLAPAAIVELVTWLAVLQMLHRLTCFFGQPPGRPRRVRGDLRRNAHVAGPHPGRAGAHAGELIGELTAARPPRGRPPSAPVNRPVRFAPRAPRSPRAGPRGRSAPTRRFRPR